MRHSLAIIEEIGAAIKSQDKYGTVMCEDATFEDGVIAALLWVIGSEGQQTLMIENLQEFEQANKDIKASSM
jgi:hypothetical protein